MERQLSIFDFMQPVEKDLEDMTEIEMVNYIGSKLGIEFYYNDFMERYESKQPKNYILDLRYDNYCTTWGSDEGNGARFISAGWGNHTGGGGRSCDSLEEAITYLRKAMDTIAKEVEADKQRKKYGGKAS